MQKILLTLLFCGLFCGAFSAGSAFAATPENHEKYWNDNKAYQGMYDLYDMAVMNAYNLLDEKDYAALEKSSDASIADSVKKNTSAGKSESDAYAIAYGEQATALDRATADVLAGDTPLAGFYLLKNEKLHGYMTVSFESEKNEYSLSFTVWEKNDPAKMGRCYAQSKNLDSKFATSGIMQPSDSEYAANPAIQMEISIASCVATVKTTEAFNKGGYVFSGFGENTVKSSLKVDGEYVFEKK